MAPRGREHQIPPAARARPRRSHPAAERPKQAHTQQHQTRRLGNHDGDEPDPAAAGAARDIDRADIGESPRPGLDKHPAAPAAHEAEAAATAPDIQEAREAHCVSMQEDAAADRQDTITADGDITEGAKLDRTPAAADGLRRPAGSSR